MARDELEQLDHGKRAAVTGGSDPFGLRTHHWSVRVPEKSEMFTGTEAQTYIDGCDYPESADDLLLALEMQQRFGAGVIRRMIILDAMCGPGRLGRELLNLGAPHVEFHDGDFTMTSHARNRALALRSLEFGSSSVNSITSPVEKMPVRDNKFDLVICHNATHQLLDIDRLALVMREFLRITVPGGHVVIADFQRATTPEFFNALEERARCTKPEIVPLLIPSFWAAFSKEEFSNILKSIPGIRKWSVSDAQLPILTPHMQEVVDKDPVKGHVMDFSPISQRVIIQKE